MSGNGRGEWIYAANPCIAELQNQLLDCQARQRKERTEQAAENARASQFEALGDADRIIGSERAQEEQAMEKTEAQKEQEEKEKEEKQAEKENPETKLYTSSGKPVKEEPESRISVRA